MKNLASISLWRRLKNRFMLSLLILSACLALFPLFNVFIYVLRQGLPAINGAFLTELPMPIGETGGGLANSIAGSLLLVGMASLVGIPWGIAVGTFLSEYHQSRLASSLRFATNLLASVPSIIVGIFVYGLVVAPMKRFSAIAGAAALVIIMIPTVARTAEEILKLMPNHIREAGLALGIPRWKVTLFIVIRGSLGGITTGVLLAIARAAGESAPLLFTALNNQYWPQGLDQPISSLPVQIFTYAITPYAEWHQKAWAAALLLVFLVFTMNLTARIVLRKNSKTLQ